MTFRFIAFALLVGACAEELPPGSLIERPRVLGARVAAAGDPMRSSPLPGEELSIEWVVAAPDVMPTFGWSFAACVATMAGGCLAPPFAVTDGSGAAPVTSLTAPATLGDGDGVLILGVICADGEPAAGTDGLPTCSGGAPSQTNVALLVPLASADEANRRPTLDSDAARLDDLAWNDIGDAEPALHGCGTLGETPSLPHVVVPQGADAPELTIAIATRSTDRESYTAIAGDPPSPRELRETLQLSSYATAGELSTQFSFIEADDEAEVPTAELTWTAPAFETLPPDGLRVRFTFVLRDGRGGLDATTRAVCAVPAI